MLQVKLMKVVEISCPKGPASACCGRQLRSRVLLGQVCPKSSLFFQVLPPSPLFKIFQLAKKWHCDLSEAQFVPLEEMVTMCFLLLFVFTLILGAFLE